MSGSQRWLLTVFIVVFPIIVFAGFLYLVVFYPDVLYGPENFRTDEAFLQLKGLARVPAPVAPESTSVEPGPLPETTPLTKAAEIEFTPNVLNEIRDAVYFTQRFVFLGHVTRRSPSREYEYEVAVFLTGWDKMGGTKAVASARFFLGPAWGSDIFDASRDSEGRLGIVTQTHDAFLALCEVTFIDGTKIVLNHFCNVEAATVS